MNNNFNKIDKATLDAARRGDKKALMSKLDEEERKKIDALLSDKNKLKQVLNSDAAKKLMKILGENNNG